MIERLDAMFAGRRVPGRDRRLRRRLDVLRRLAVPELDRHRPLPRLPVRRGRAVRRRALPDGADRDHRGLTGKSSGGYGAMVVPMLRPDVFGALASHAGDALFEACYLPEFPKVARLLRDEFDGSWDAFFERARERRPAAVGVDRAARGLRLRRRATRPIRRSPGRALLPFDVPRAADRRRLGAVAATGTRCGWRPPTPTRCARCAASTSTPAARDEYYLDLGAQAFGAELDKLGVGAHARALRRHARAPDVPLPGRDPGAGARARAVTGTAPSRAHASTAGHGP